MFGCNSIRFLTGLFVIGLQIQQITG